MSYLSNTNLFFSPPIKNEEEIWVPVPPLFPPMHSVIYDRIVSSSAHSSGINIFTFGNHD